MKKLIKKSVKRKKKTKKAKKPTKVTLNFKVKQTRAKQIKAMANRLTRGNVTALVEAGLTYIPFHAKAIAKKECRATTRT